MKKLNQPLRRMLDLAQRRFVRSRAGSVLILVVALLVLMALIGTAFMTMAQFDRVAAVQHTANTEVDLLVEGVINQVKGVIAGDLFANGKFRPAANSAVTPSPTYNSNQSGTYTYYNGVGYDPGSTQVTAGANPGNWWLASRLPVRPNETAVVSATANPPGWSFITGAINGTGTFNQPNSTKTYTLRTGLYPCVTGGYPFTASQTTVDGQYFPALYDPNSTNSYFAADADGDGIADAGLVKLLVLDGITYYGAVRIIDNSAAINATIATRPNATVTLTPAAAPYTAMPGDYSPANLDLEGMLSTPATELYGTSAGALGLLNYRFNNLNPSTYPQAPPINENGTARSDFSYMLYNYGGFNLAFDQQWMQLGRRMDNPGNISVGTIAADKYQALPISESMVMAKGFILHDPSVTSSSSSSILENRLSTTAFSLSPSSPYQPPTDPTGAVWTVGWFKNNFSYALGANTTMPMRALLVDRNPVSCFTPGKFFDQGVSTTGTTTASGAAFNFGDMITYPAAGGCRYVCINFPPAAAPLLTSTGDPDFQDPNWAYEPWTTSPTLTDVNTASFQQLYAAYWAVMADQYTAATGVWTPPYPNAAAGDAPGATAGRMFRNPIRSTTPVLTQQQVMYLRAAIAAVNTMQLRASPTVATNLAPDVISRTITIPGAGGYKATIYGAEKEPYITQVYARNSATSANDWIGIELFNPYPVQLGMNNFQFVAFNRAAKTLKVIAAIPNVNIPANGRIVYVTNTTNTAIKLPPTPPGVSIVTVSTLTGANYFGKELLVMRARSALATTPGSTATAKTSTWKNNYFTESFGTTVGNPNDLVPVDSYDFSNLPLTSSATTNEEWDYVRPTTSPAKNWHCVYPGPWNATTSPNMPTLGGTAYKSPATGTQTTATTNLGTAQGTVAAGTLALKYQDVPLQINNTDFGGPFKVTSATAASNTYPFGGFARNADILEVTYIGAYKIWTGALNAAETAETIVEVNALPMDSAMATSSDTSPYTPLGTTTLAAENIGRFCPVDKNDTAGAVNDFAIPAAGATTTSLWRYQWATRLFDYLTVNSPQNDFLPQVDPWHQEPTGNPLSYKYFPAASNVAAIPQPVANVTSGLTNGVWPSVPSRPGTPPAAGGAPAFNSNNATEETAPINGLVNINTAPWRTLAAVPWVPGSVIGYQALNAQIAQAIVYYRDIRSGSGLPPHGPFKSIFELSDVPYPQGSATLLRNYLANAAAYQTPQYGYIAPMVATASANSLVTGDFEMQFQAIARVSNLITTRSDSYTAYILVQGWSNAETANAHLVVQRRAAVILDRSVVTQNNSAPSVVNVPLN